mmetsp:Transcript_9831/g.41860  ORF Transcript_9831/g.41860 Transcript_9831/m.41860 type:complete len:87 (-) Transcript_9831:87-347(-)
MALFSFVRQERLATTSARLGVEPGKMALFSFVRRERLLQTSRGRAVVVWSRTQAIWDILIPETIIFFENNHVPQWMTLNTQPNLER